MTMDIRYRASCKINIFDRKMEFFTFSPKNINANKKLKFRLQIFTCLIVLYILFSKLSIDISYFCVTWIWNFIFLLALILYIGENINKSILRWKISNLQLALYLIFTTMSKTKHPANMVLLTESEQFVHISDRLSIVFVGAVTTILLEVNREFSLWFKKVFNLIWFISLSLGFQYNLKKRT